MSRSPWHLEEDLARQANGARRSEDWLPSVGERLAALGELESLVTSPDQVPRDAHCAVLHEQRGSVEGWGERQDLLAVSAFRPTPRLIEILASLPRLRVLRLNHVRRAELAPLRGNSGLVVLSARWLLRHEDLGFLQGMTSLESLELLDLKRLDLDTLPDLPRLASLAISAVGQGTIALKVRSLAPLAQLTRLTSLRLDDIVPIDGSLEPIHELTSLERVRITDRFTVEECARLAGALPGAEGDTLTPFSGAAVAIAHDVAALPSDENEDDPVLFDRRFGHCPKDGRRLVRTTGRPSRTLCLECDFAKLARHLARWEAARRGAAEAR